LPKVTLRRLQAIQEFTELGSGFNLAMRDLEIRGAGNLLGSEQSGFILEMGFEMYIKIVEEAVGELREEESVGLDVDHATNGGGSGVVVEEKERAGNVTSSSFSRDRQATTVDVDVPALIPDIYIESDAERLDVYRRLAAINADEDLISMRDELRDRFGEYPEEVENLLGVVSLRLAAERLGAVRVELEENRLTIALPAQDAAWFYEEIGGMKARFQALMECVSTMQHPRLQLRQEGKSLFLRGSLRGGDRPDERIAGVHGLLARLSEAA
jgi:transcription-repair coupling factor (superfamily II helicase)